MTAQYTPPLPEVGAKPDQIARTTNALLRGKFNSTGTITLDSGSTTTTLTDLNIGLDSVILLAPKSANAKAEGIPWYSITTKGSATITHVNNGQTDRDYGYVIVG